MAVALPDNEWLLMAPRRQSRATVGWLAVVVSGLLHGLLALEMPPIRMAPRDWGGGEVRVSLTVTSVQPEPPAAFADHPEAFRPEEVDASFVSPVPPPSADVLDPSRIDAARPALPETAPLRPPEPIPERAEWRPRQQRLEVAEETVADEIAARPRRVVPAVERVPMASDIVDAALPVPSPLRVAPRPAGGAAAPTGEPAAAADMSPPPAEPPAIAPPAPLPARPADESASPADAAMPTLPGGSPASEVVRAGRERTADVTGMAPIEHRLRLDVSAWTPPDEAGWRYIAIRVQRATEDVLPVLPRAVLFVQDCSASMGAPKVAAARRGLHAALQSLRDDDMFEIISFRESVARCFGEWTPATPAARARAGWFVEQMESRGMTDVYAVLGMILGLPSPDGRPLVVIMISDGRPTVGLQDNFEIIQRFTDANQGRVSVYSIGTGRGANRFLLDFLSRKNRGESQVFMDLNDVPGGIDQITRQLARPVLAELSYRLSSLDENEVYPRLLTHLYLDRPLILYGRVPAGASSAAVRVIGRSGATPYDMVFPLDLAGAAEGGAVLREAWTRQKLAWLIGEHIRTRDPAYRDAAASLARRMGADAPYAAELGLASAPGRAR